MTESAISQYPTRQRILAAALKLFVEQGYFNTNIPDLSRESRCSVGSIYHTFRNKAEIASALYEEGIFLFRTAIFESIQDVKGEEETLRAIIYSLLEFAEMNHQLSRYLWLCRHSEFMEGLTRHPTRVGFDKLGRLLTKNIRRGIKQGKIRKLSASILWSALFGMPLAYVRDWLEGFTDQTPKEASSEIAESCWRAIKAP